MPRLFRAFPCFPRRWSWNSDGSLSGRVFGKKGYKEGEAMNTSVVPPESRFRTYVVTGSGSIYRLGEKLEPADKSKMKRSLTDDGAVERSGSARGAAQAAREKMTAAAAAAAALSEETKRRKEREAAAAAAAAEAAEEELRQPTRESPRDRKRPMPGSSGAATADGTEEPRKKHANQYTKAAALAAAAAAAGKGVSSPRPSGKDASGGDRPRHANQHTKAAEQRAAAAAAAAERTASAGGSSSTGKHPNQYTYKQSAGASSSGKGIAGADTPSGKPRHANQYTVRPGGQSTSKHPNQYTYRQQDGLPRPKQPNQYTKAAEAAAAAAAAAAANAPADAYFLGVSRVGEGFCCRLVRQGSDEILGTYRTSKAAYEALAEIHAQLQRNATNDAEAAEKAAAAAGGGGRGERPPRIDVGFAPPTPSSPNRRALPMQSPAGSSAAPSSAHAAGATPMPPPSAPGSALFAPPTPLAAGSTSRGSSVAKIRVALVDTVDHSWVASPLTPAGYEFLAVDSEDYRAAMANGGTIGVGGTSKTAAAVGAGGDESEDASTSAAGAKLDPDAMDVDAGTAPSDAASGGGEGSGANGASDGNAASGSSNHNDGNQADDADSNKLVSPTRSSNRTAAAAANALLSAMASGNTGSGKVDGGGASSACNVSSSASGFAPPSAAALAAASLGSMWMQCESCLKWRKLAASGALSSLGRSHGGDVRWTCQLVDATCDLPQEASSHPAIDGKLGLFGAPVDASDGEARDKGGRELRPPRPQRGGASGEDAREGRSGKSGRARDGDDGEGKEGKGKSSRGEGKEGKGGGRGSAKGKEYLNGFSLGRTTRIAVHEDGIWRFQPAVGEQYQIETEPGPTCPTAESCRKRTDQCVWDPVRAEVEGIKVESYLASAEKLYAVGGHPKLFSSEAALQLLYSHSYDVLAATHSIATSIGVDKLLSPDAPVTATTALVRGKAGLRVGLTLSLRHPAPSLSSAASQQPGARRRASSARRDRERRRST